ncbi:tail assembly protein, partial [Escherichia albertii]|nr:tail assembly protein [Escherichia albertii]
FKAWMKRNIKTYDRYHIQITNKQGLKWSVDESEYQMMGQSDNIAKIRITPVPRGSGGSAFGWFQTVVGAVLMVASIWVPALAPLGLSLMMGGIAQIISPQATNESVRQADNSNSYYFDGPQNTTNQGNPVQLIYGEEILVGSQVVSSSITIDQLM